MKVVINDCYGGFGLSYKAVMKYAEFKGIKLYGWIDNIHKKIYGKRARLTNPNILVHYSTIPIKDEDDYNKKRDEEESTYFLEDNIERTDSLLVRVIEELGEKASAKYAKLKIIEIPDNIEWIIEEYDGLEWIAEKHRTWGN